MPGGFVRTFVFYIVRKEKHPTDPKKCKAHINVYEEIIADGKIIRKPLGTFSHIIFGTSSYTEVKNYLCRINEIDSKYLQKPYLRYTLNDVELFGFEITKI